MTNDIFLFLIFIGLLVSIYSIIASIIKAKIIIKSPEKSSSSIKDIIYLSWAPIVTALLLYLSGFVYAITYEYTRDFWTAFGNGFNGLFVSVGGFLLIMSSYLMRRFLFKNKLISSNKIFRVLFFISIGLIVLYPIMLFAFSLCLY